MSSRRVAIVVAFTMLVPVALPLIPSAAAATLPTPSIADFAVFQHASWNGGEPTIGMNPNTGAMMMQLGVRTAKITIDWTQSTPVATWTSVTPPNTGVANIDPMMFTDLGTGRTFAGGLDGECSVMAYTDADGATGSWVPTGNQCAGAFDHQTIGQGPWREPAPAQAVYDRATYYCAQGWINFPQNACVTSYDGGIAYSPPIMWEGNCFGLHGHVNVSWGGSGKGTAFVPTRDCNGGAGFAWTEDNGLTWNDKRVAPTNTNGAGFDPSVGTSSNGRVWFAYEGADFEPMAGFSDDNGATFGTFKNVGADIGISKATFMRVMSGDPERAAVVYLGSTTDEYPYGAGFSGVWDLYASFTYDSGATWSTVKITSDTTPLIDIPAAKDPVQRGWICAGGLGCSSGRNLLDFMGSSLTPEGKVIVGFPDGCVACVSQSGSSGSRATIAIQANGRGLFAEYDATRVDILTPLTGTKNVPMTLTADITATTPYTGSIVWGDGAVEPVSGSAPQLVATHTYATNGNFDVTVSITGADGSSAFDTAQASISGTGGGRATIAVTSHADGDDVNDALTLEGTATIGDNLAPEAAFTFTVSGFDVSFDATGSSDPDNDPLTFVWDFGDASGGAGVTTSHTYSSAGTYEACLTVGDGGLTDELCQTITIGSSGEQLATDPEGDARNPNGAGQTPSVDSLDITELSVSTSAQGEPVFTVKVKNAASTAAPAGEGAVGAYWRVEWTHEGKVDFTQFSAALTSTRCDYGDTDTNGIYSGRGSAPCTFTPGSPAVFTITYPVAALGSRGYSADEVLTNLRAGAGVYRGTPQDVSVYAGGTTEYDTTTTTEWQYPAAGLPFANLGLVHELRAAKAAPTTVPANPQITDKTADPVGDNVPQLDIDAGWFESDADFLYVGLKLQDIPADPTSTAFLFYGVNFKPEYTIADPTWGGAKPAANTFTGLRALALYSPVRGSFNPVGASSDTATVFELQVLSTSATGSNFGRISTVTGSISAETDIIWWQIPRALLQNPGSNDVLSTTSAASAPAVGGVVTFGTLYGDATGTGESYGFPQDEVIPPVVTLTPSVTSGTAPLSVTFTTSVDTPNVATWSLDFGDSTTPASGSGSPPPATIAHTYSATGTYTATLHVLAANGGEATATSPTITVGTTPPPTLSVVVSAPGLEPVQAVCTADCATWSADLDLSPLAEGAVTLTATLFNQGAARATDTVVVDLLKPQAIVIDTPVAGADVITGDLDVAGRITGSSSNDLAPVAFLDADKSSGLAPLTVTFTLDGQDDNGVTSWEFTDGNGFATSGTSLPQTIQRTYSSAGTYLPSLTVRDVVGHTDSETAVITAQAANQPPTTPSNPVPPSGATNLAVPLTLSWTSTDPDGTTPTFDVYIDGTLVASDQTSSYIPSGLEWQTTYTWYVVAKDGIDSTTGPEWTFTTGTRPLTEADRPHVVVALIDTGTNPYHQQFRRPELVDNPSTYISGLSASQLVEVDLCFYDPTTKTVDQTRCPNTASAAATADASKWAPFDVSSGTGAGQGEVAWFPGTNAMLVSFGHNGDANYPGLDGSKGAGDSHGTWTSSNVAGSTTGTCPECIFVMIEGDDVDPIVSAYAWAANQPWIDVITSSVSIGLIGLGANPADFFEASSASTKTAVTNGKIVFEAAGNGVANAGLAPMSTFLYANSNPWTIPVGCSAEMTGQPCGYHDFPNPVTASGVSRVGASVDTFTGTAGVGGTSFSSPSTAGVAGRILYSLRTAMNDTEEGPSNAANGKTLVRVGGGKTAPATGPFANGKLTKLELEEVIFKTARRGAIPKVPEYILPNDEIPQSPVSFIKEGFGNVYRGDWGVNGPGAEATWSSAGDATAVILGQKAVPQRWMEEFWWEQVVTPAQVAVFGADVGESDGSDAYPRDDPADPNSVQGYDGPSSFRTPEDLATLRVAVPPVGAVPTPDNKRVFLHHANHGPDPNSPVGNSLIEYYMNSVRDPSNGQPTCAANCADDSGLGGTGVFPAGGENVYLLDYPMLGGPVLLDGEVTVHVEAKNWAGAPATVPPQLTFTLTSGGSLVGTVVASGTPSATNMVFEASFEPLVGVLSDPVELHVAWAGPVASIHLASQGASWMDLPVVATLPPITYEPLKYYVDDLDAFGSNGATVLLTRDASKLAADADADSFWPFPQASGLVINMESEDSLTTGSLLLASEGSATVYLCTNTADAGVAQYTARVSLYVGGTPLGGGSLTQTMVGPNTGRTVPVTVPLTLFPALMPKNVPITGNIVLSGPGGAFTENMGLCGGSAAHPWSINLQVADLDAAPSATIDTITGTLSNTVTLSGTATFPAVPGVAEVTYFAQNMDAWDTANGQTMTMDVGTPGTGNGGPIFLDPMPNGFDITLRSAAPAATHTPAISAEGIGAAQIWITALGGSSDVTVDATVFLWDGVGAQRLVGAGSVTKSLMAPLGAVQPLVEAPFVVSFAPSSDALVPTATEHLYVKFVVHNVGPAATNHLTCYCGGADKPLFVKIPTPASTQAVGPEIQLEVGGVVRDVPVANGLWSIDLDTRAIANGEHTLTVTPRALYGGVQRTGSPVDTLVTVQNVAVNTPPTASLTLLPSNGFAPLDVTANLGGNDADDDQSELGWTLDWGDGSAVASGTGLPASPTHTYTDVGSYVARITVIDTGLLEASATASATAITPPPVEKVILLVNGANPVDATDDSGDGSFREWSKTINFADAGLYTITARHMRGDEMLTSASVDISVHVPEIPDIVLDGPAAGADVAPGDDLIGQAICACDVTGVVVSTSSTFESAVVDATTDDAFAHWRVELDSFVLPEDAVTTLYVRATSADGSSYAQRDVKLNAAPNAIITVITPLPVGQGTDIEFQADAVLAASGAPITGYAWNFGDGSTSDLTNPTHAYADAGLYTVTLTATDANGRVGSESLDLSIFNTLPTATLDVSPTLIDTTTSATLTVVGADTDGSIVSEAISVYEGTTTAGTLVGGGASPFTFTFPDNGQYLVVGSVKDDDDATATAETVVTVENLRPLAVLVATPTLVAPDDIVTFDASGSADPDGSVVMYRFALGDGTIVDQAEPILTHSYATAGLYDATVTVTDDDGSSELSAAVTIQVNSRPVLGDVGNHQIDEGETITIDLAAQDAENDPLTFSVNATPTGASLNPQTGVFVFTTSVGSAGNYFLTFSVTDGVSTDSVQSVISVGDVPIPPVLEPIGAKSGAETQALTFTVVASDLDSAFTLSASGLPAGATFDAQTGAFAWTPSYTQAGVYTLMFSVTDGTFTVAEAVAITIANVDRAPTLNNLATGSVKQLSTITIPLQASDPDGDLILWSVSGPAGATIQDLGSGNAKLLWTPSVGQLGAHTFVVTATSGSLFASKTTTLTALFKTDVTATPVGSTSVKTVPGQTLSFTTTVKNTGPNVDTFRISAANDGSLAVTGVPAPITLAPGESRTFTVQVTASASKATSWTTITATSLGDSAISKSARFRYEIPVVIAVSIDQGPVGDAPSGVVYATYIDGSNATGVSVSVMQTPKLFGPQFRETATGTTDANGLFGYDFTDPYGLLPGAHSLYVRAKLGNGPETIVSTEYVIAADLG